MPYDRQYWSGAFKSNRLDVFDHQTRNALKEGVNCLKRYIHQVELSGQILKYVRSLLVVEDSTHVDSFHQELKTLQRFLMISPMNIYVNGWVDLMRV